MATEKTGVIYRIYHKASMKSYVGKTVGFDKRIQVHFNRKSPCVALCRAIKKYSRDAFCVEILESNVPESILSKMEILHIRFFNCKSPNGYNLTDGGEGISGYQHSPETRRKISGSNQGKTHSPEARRKISESHRGKKHSPETRQKMSETRKGEDHHFYGKTHSPETRRKISETKKGRPSWNKGKSNPYSDETLEKMSQAKKGRVLSPETRKKMSGKTPWMKGKSHSPETRRRISESLKRRNLSS